jgi:hypothetical protein
MSLPVYRHIHVRTDSIDDLVALLSPDLNVKNPVAFHLVTLNLDQQKEMVGIIENYFDTENVSFKFPYPIYVISGLESSISGMPMTSSQDELPKFFSQKEGRMNVKETHLALKNKLLNQEIKNVDPRLTRDNLEAFALEHRQIYELQIENSFYRVLLQKMGKVKKRG